MATNKHAIIRYQALDKCFRNPGRKYFIDDLAEACSNALNEFSGEESGVQIRQIYEDIKFMESAQGWNAPLEKLKEGRRVYYRYDDLNFSINNQPLNEREEIQLREALMTLSRFKGMPQFEWVSELTAKLEQGLGLGKSQKVIMEFEQNQYLKGLEHITPIYEAIKNETVLEISYQSFKQDEPIVIIISPYYLKQYNNRWFLFGTTTGFANLTNLPLDRMIGIAHTDKEFQINNAIDFDEYFEDVIGVSKPIDSSISKILLEVKNELWKYLETKPLHGSQKIVERRENSVVISLELFINYELKSKLFAFMDKITVLEPANLVAEMQSISEAIGKNYQ